MVGGTQEEENVTEGESKQNKFVLKVHSALHSGELWPHRHRLEAFAARRRQVDSRLAERDPARSSAAQQPRRRHHAPRLSSEEVGDCYELVVSSGDNII